MSGSPHSRHSPHHSSDNGTSWKPPLSRSTTMPTSHTLSRHGSDSDIANHVATIELNDLTQRSGTSEQSSNNSPNNTITSNGSVHTSVYHKYHLDPIIAEPEWFQRIALPPWAEHPIPAEKLVTLAVLLEWVLHLWHADYISSTIYIQRIWQLGSHPETFIRPHPMFSHQQHAPAVTRQHTSEQPASHGGSEATALMSSSERNSRIRGFLLYDSRMKRWHQKLTPQQVDNFGFFFNLATHCQAILQGHPAYLQNPMYMSSPTWLDQAPDSTHGKQRLNAAYNAMQKVVLKELGIDRPTSSALNSRNNKRRSLMQHNLSPPGSGNELAAMIERTGTVSMHSHSGSHTPHTPGDHSMTIRNNGHTTARPPLHRSNSIPTRHHHDTVHENALTDKPTLNERRPSTSQRNSKSLHVARHTSTNGDGDDMRSPSPVPLDQIRFDAPSDTESSAAPQLSHEDDMTTGELLDQVDHQIQIGALQRRKSLGLTVEDDEVPPDLLRSLHATEQPGKHHTTMSAFAMPSPDAKKPRTRMTIGERLDNISATQKHVLDGLAVTAAIGYFIVTPWVLFCVFYGGVITTLESGAVAWILPNLVQIVSYYRLRRIKGIMSMSSDKSFVELIRTSSYRQLTQRLYQWIWLTTGDWYYETYHLLVTFLACSSYLYYSYVVSYQYFQYDADGTPIGKPSYILSTSDSAHTYLVQIEFFIQQSLGFDYIIRFISSPSLWYFFKSKYAILDFVIFTAVTFLSYVTLDLDPHILPVSYYSLYLLSGPFRWLRVRRTFMTLDHSHTILMRNGKAKQVFMLGPIELRPITARIVLLIVRVLIYVFATANIVMWIEYPCISFYPSDPSVCNLELQQFHFALYFVVVTLSTVGYGDLYCVTSPGRMMMCLIILGALLHVPRLANDFSAIINDSGEKQKEKEREEQQLETRYDAEDGLDDDDFQLGADAFDFQDEARLRGLLAARERAKTLAEDSEEEEDEEQETSKSSKRNRRDEREVSHVRTDGKPTTVATVVPSSAIAQLPGAPSVNAVLEASLDNSAERHELYRFLELQLLRSHSMNEVIQLCNVWHVEYTHRSQAARRLVQTMFDLQPAEHGSIEEHYASPDSSPEPEAPTNADVIPINT